MSAFDWLFVAHFIGDFLFQNGWMARYKSEKWLPLLTHVAVYTLVLAAFGLFTGVLNGWGVAVIFFSHLAIDRKSFVQFWILHIQTVPACERKWMSVVTDQVFHLIMLVVALYVSGGG